MHKILVIRLYFILYALHVSDYISPSSGATFISCTSRLVYADTFSSQTSDYIFFAWSIVRPVHSLLQSEYNRECFLFQIPLSSLSDKIIQKLLYIV